MYQNISMKQLEAMLNGPRDFVLLDVRGRDEFARGHLEGAVNIPVDELEWSLHLLPAGRRIIVYCAYGGHSMMAARYLDSRGYPVTNANGGLSYYRGTHLVR